MPEQRPPHPGRPQPGPAPRAPYPGNPPTARYPDDDTPTDRFDTGGRGVVPRRSKRPRWLPIAGIGALLVVAVVVGLVVALNRDDSSPTPGLAPVAPAEAHGKRPITAVATSSGRTITVAKDGSGQFTSIKQAADQAQPGDTIVIGAGTYDETLDVTRSGAENAYITFHAAPGANVVITGNPDGRDGLVYVRGRQWIKFVGLTIKDSDDHGIYIVDSKHIVVQDVEVSQSRDGGAVFLDSSDVQVLHSNILGNNAQGTDASNEAVTFSNVDGFEIGFCIVEGNGEEGIDAKYEARNGKIHDNTANKNRGPNIYIDAAHSIDIYNNIVTGAHGENKAGVSIGVEDVSETRRTNGIRVYNNIVMGNAGGGISFFVESSGTFTDIQIINNTVINNTGDGINPRDYEFTGTNLLRNNIIAGNTQDTAGKSSSIFTADHNLFSNNGVGSDIVTAAPEFVDADGGDLRLTEKSPGVNAGSPEGAPPGDINGTPRPEGKIDLGAFEDTGKEPVR